LKFRKRNLNKSVRGACKENQKQTKFSPEFLTFLQEIEDYSDAPKLMHVSLPLVRIFGKSITPLEIQGQYLH
jgi:hypothetical protein